MGYFVSVVVGSIREEWLREEVKRSVTTVNKYT